MYQKPVLDVSDAMAVLEAMLNAAPNTSSKPLGMAVVDEHGDLLAFARMDGTPPFPAQFAIKKAYTAARMRSDARGLRERFRAEGRSVADFGDPNLVLAMGGGIAIVAPQSDHVLGGIGVSGGTPDEDEQVARAGLEALSAKG